MPAAAVPISGVRHGEYVILEAALPGHAPRNIGVLLIDPASGRGWVRMRPHFDDFAEPDDAEVLAALEDDMLDRIEEVGGAAYLAMLEDTLSNAIRVSERRAV